MHYRLTAPNGQVLDEGDGTAELAGGAIVVSPAFGQPIRVRPADVVELSEPAPYVVRLRLAEGPALDLSQLGAIRTQLVAQMGQARAQDLTSALLVTGVGAPEIFPGAVGDIEAEIRLYDDALVAIPVAGDPEQVPYPFVKGVETDASGYRLSIEVTGRDGPLVVNRLARRTSEFADLLKRRFSQASGRTSAFLGSLLPGLGPIALRSVASALRDGVAARKETLDAVDPTIWPSLVKAATLRDRVAGVGTLEAMGPVWIGFKQMVSVERPAEGVTGRADPAQAPHIGEHDQSASTFAGGLAGVMTAGMLQGGPPTHLGFDGPFGSMGGMLALSMLGVGGGGFGMGSMGIGGGAAQQHQQLPRPDMSRDRLTPASTDTAALAASGDAPTVLAFVFCQAASDAVVYEVLNQADHATYVYRGDTGLEELNRALDLIGFRVEAVYQDAAAGSEHRKAVERLPYLRALRTAFAGRAIHTEGWEGQLRSLL